MKEQKEGKSKLKLSITRPVVIVAYFNKEA